MLARSSRRVGATALRCGARGLATGSEGERPWAKALDEETFGRLRTLLAAPSPVGLEGAMTQGVLEPRLREIIPSAWKVHKFRSQAAMVVDTDPKASDDKLTVMVVGHADKIRMQVKKIANDGKVFIDSDSHLALTLLGRDVAIFSEDAETPGEYRVIRGGTVEALGAIHFAEANIRTGQRGIKAEQLYVELGIHGKNKKKQVTEGLGLRPGDSIIMEKPIRRGVGCNTFTGAYLDNGLGCWVAAEACEQMAQDPAFAETLEKVRVLFAFATHEEIGRFGSRVLAQTFKPDVLIAVDVNHDYVAAPGIASKQMPDLAMGEGPTLSVGSITSAHLNATIQRAARRADIPLQIDVVGRDTGTDAMAGVLASVDAASTSIGIPIRNMHTVSETGCTDDLVAATHLFVETVRELGRQEADGVAFAHPNLTDAKEITSIPAHLFDDEDADGEDSKSDN
ncbi:Cytoplasmic M42 family peptidase [Hondaea fermentalgiana]|uniref:Cytoplasmic M42 family peptidase n=1 Tax=Hondaea fermentalgiana TaxID=2315210 RepID=A0A2R5GIZ7_9STRA|nr:Cytoplasmic M42 family peptidase [Hondaea fermentalgiana]|eukprot:GBG30860.1 Cytoplasmic M42 family peptidase [Hondaea fermentalgiana]